MREIDSSTLTEIAGASVITDLRMFSGIRIVCMAVTWWNRKHPDQTLRVQIDDKIQCSSMIPNYCHIILTGYKNTKPTALEQYISGTNRGTVTFLNDNGNKEIRLCGSAIDDDSVWARLCSALPLIEYNEKDSEFIQWLTFCGQPVFTPMWYDVVMKDYDNIRNQRLAKMISGMREASYKAKKEEVQEQLLFIQREFENIEAKIHKLEQQRQDLTFTLCGIEHAKENDEDVQAVADYITNNKQISVTCVTETRLRFCVRTYLDMFVEDDAEKFAERNPEYKCLFGEDQQGRYRLRTYAYFDMDNFGHITPCTGERLTDWGIPNPHLNYFACLGGFREMLVRAAQDRDIVKTMELCAAVTRNMNFLDSACMSKLVADLRNTKNDKVIEDRDGNMFSLEELNR